MFKSVKTLPEGGVKVVRAIAESYRAPPNHTSRLRTRVLDRRLRSARTVRRCAGVPPVPFEKFRSQAVRLVLDDGKTIGAVARDLDLTPSALRLCVRRAQADRTHGRTGLTTAEHEELARLRKEIASCGRSAS